MHTRRDLLGTVAMAGAALAGCSGDEGGGGRTPSEPGGLTVTSAAFDAGGPIPARYTADGADVSPPLSIVGRPDGVESLAVVVDDPDAPGGTFVHWLLWDLPPGRRQIPEGVPTTDTVGSLGGATQGTNGFGSVGYRGPSPPADDGPHTYRFTVYALDTTLDLDAGASRGDLDDEMAGQVLASGRLTGTYDR